MKKIQSIPIGLIGAIFFTGTCCVTAQEPPPMPEPTAEHTWLERFLGEWESEVTVHMNPEEPPMEIKVAEQFRPIGGFWAVGEIESQTPEMPFAGVYTLGYDAEAGEYIGFWIESMTGNLMKYRGSVEAAGDTLTMEAEGLCPMRPGETTRFREVTEFIADDHRRVTSSIFVDGEWVENVRIESRRK